jgi:hypothetical protein
MKLSCRRLKAEVNAIDEPAQQFVGKPGNSIAFVDSRKHAQTAGCHHRGHRCISAESDDQVWFRLCQHAAGAHDCAS